MMDFLWEQTKNHKKIAKNQKIPIKKEHENEIHKTREFS